MFIRYTLSELLYQFPLGAGLGRWGMMHVYFGDPTLWQAPPIHVEVQLTGWLLDGGVPLWLLYGGRCRRGSASTAIARLFVRRHPRAQDIATIVLCLQLTIVCLCLTGPVFNTQLGILFWAMTGATLRSDDRPGRSRESTRSRRCMAESRLRRFVGGLGLGYIHTIVTVVVGLWLTPYLLRHLGSHDYGLWLLGAQVLVYLALMDLGVVQLVPRDVAIAAGRANGDSSELQAIVGQTARLVLWQVPPVALVGGLDRVVPAGGVGAAALAAGDRRRRVRRHVSAADVQRRAAGSSGPGVSRQRRSSRPGRRERPSTIGGIASGLGLYSLSTGWVPTQLVSAIVGWRRLVTAHGHVLSGATTVARRCRRSEQSDRQRRLDQRQSGRAGACSAAPISSSSASCSDPKPWCRTPAPASS